MCSAVMLLVGTKSLNHGPHQLCSGLRMRIPVWICCATVYERFMRHGLSLTGVDHPIDHGMTSNYVPDILTYYARFRYQELES